MSIVERAIAKAAALEREQANALPPSRAISRMPPELELDPAPLSSGSETVDLGVESLRRCGLAPTKDMEHVVTEELRLIKRPLLVNAESAETPVANGNVIMIGSALPGAGKTFISLNLALSIASEFDWRVLLIDADTTRSTLTRSLGLSSAPGLVGLLEQPRGVLADHVFKTSRRGLHVLPAGPARPNAKELLASHRMRTLVADLAARDSHAIVLFDSPPLLVTSEARVLASYVGQVVLVVEADTTPRRSVLEAIELLDHSKPINLVLNKSRRRAGMGDYPYGGYEPSVPSPNSND